MAEVAVIGLPDERWIEAVTAVVVLKEGAELTAETVRAHVKERLAGFKVPKRVDFVAELPRNQSGKLLKRALRAERIALNFTQRMSGIATLTRAFVDAAGGRTRIADTRKTTPGLRALENLTALAEGRSPRDRVA